MKTSKFPLIGLSRPKSATCLFNKDSHFHPKVELSQDRFDALWKFCKDNWSEKKYAIIEYSKLNNDGCPIDAKLIDISLQS